MTVLDKFAYASKPENLLDMTTERVWLVGGICCKVMVDQLFVDDVVCVRFVAESCNDNSIVDSARSSRRTRTARLR